jgi:hypothetical protein
MRGYIERWRLEGWETNWKDEWLNREMSGPIALFLVCPMPMAILYCTPPPPVQRSTLGLKHGSELIREAVGMKYRGPWM